MKSVLSLFLIWSIVYCQDRIKNDSIFYSDIPLKNPTTSILLSMAIPGGGQFYNESYVRSALYLSTVSYFVATALINQNRIDDIEENRVIFETEAERSNRIDTYYNKRNVAIWRSFGFYLLNILDAWAGAYLFGFNDIMDNETRNVSITHSETSELMFKFSYNF